MRDCKNCIHITKNGCDSWDCEFEKRMPNEEAIKVLEMVEAHGIADRAKRTAIRKLKNEQTDGDLISRTDLLKDIADLKKSPWFNSGKDIKDLFQHNSYVARKEAAEIIEDLCIKKLPSAEKTTINHEKTTITDTDLISKIDKLPRIKVGNSNSPTVKYCIDEVLLYDLLENMPSAEKIAVFKIVGNTKQHYECSKCNEPVDGWDKFCKHCGARLVL